MTLAQIHKLLKEHGAMSELARKLGVSKTAVHLVLTGKSRSERILKAANAMAVRLRSSKSKR